MKNALRVEALEAIYRRSFCRFLRVALAIVGDRETATDVVQEAFAKAIQARFQFAGNSAPEAWVWTIVVSLARERVRRDRRRPAVPDESELRQSSDAEARWPELRAAVASLPERQRLAVFLRHYADMDYEQIAAVLGIARGTVAASLNAAHTTLRKEISEVLR